MHVARRRCMWRSLPPYRTTNRARVDKGIPFTLPNDRCWWKSLDQPNVRDDAPTHPPHITSTLQRCPVSSSCHSTIFFPNRWRLAPPASTSTCSSRLAAHDVYQHRCTAVARAPLRRTLIRRLVTRFPPVHSGSDSWISSIT